MIPQAHLIGSDYSVYYDLIAADVVMFLGMVACSVWLARHKRPTRFIGLVWSGFFVLLLLGTLGMSASIHSQRLFWRDNLAKLVASYADFVSRLDHEKIQPGQPESFSDWSEPVVLQPGAQNYFQGGELIGSEKSEPVREKLAVPKTLIAGWHTPFANATVSPTHIQRRNQWAVAALTGDNKAFGRCTQQKQIQVQWYSVSQATTYRLQWRYADDKNAKWITVYTGSSPGCILTAPEDRPLEFRIRAEDGTPEDDPVFTQLVDALDCAVKANVYIGYAYTMRFVDPERMQFIVSPISDANHDGVIDADEVPNDIGEFYPTTPLFQYIRNHKERAMYFKPFDDRWGKWFTIAEPIWTADRTSDGVLAMDFRVSVVHHQMFLGRIYPLCLFSLVAFFYFVAILFISRLQREMETVNRLADKLKDTVSELTESKHVTDKALQTKTLFLTNMSHEFRTPLNAMLGFTEILARRVKDCATEQRTICAEAIKQMRESGKNLLELVENVLSVAALDENQTLRLNVAPVNLRSLIADVADMLRSRAEGKSLTLTVVEPQNIPEWVGSDPAHIRQVLIHLIGNAIKFTQQGGVSIRYGISSEPGMLFISVSDTGIGIDPDRLHSVFKPFSQSDPTLTRKYGGTGIGLSVARQSAEMLNGSIVVESQLERGSTFTFTFPGPQVDAPPGGEIPKVPSTEVLPDTKILHIDPASPLTPQTASGVGQILAGCRVLYVEDTKINQIVLSNQLTKAGAIVELADNGQIGIDKIAEAETQGKPFDIILMDMQMPVLDGYEATRHLRTSGYAKPIIAVTAHALPGDREKTLDAGCSEYITKPVDYGKLFVMIKMLWK